MKLSSTYQRFLFMLSLTDIINSLFLLLHPFLIPKEDQYHWAGGSQKTCTFVGFFFVFGALSVSIYSCWLAVYFYYSIQSSPKREKEPEDFIDCPERLAHLFGWIAPIGLGAAAAGTGSIDLDPGFDFCMISSEEDVLSYVFQGLILLFTLLAIMATVSIHMKVKSTIKKGKEPDDDANSITLETSQRLTAVSSQAVLYTATYIMCFIWPAIAITISPSSANAYFALQFLAYAIYPLQGVMNCSIYLRPRYSMLRQMYPRDSALVVFRMAASKAGDPEEIEEVRAVIYGSDYESPSEGSSEHSLASDLPSEVAFDPEKRPSITSMVSAPEDHDDPPEEDPEAKPTASK